LGKFVAPNFDRLASVFRRFNRLKSLYQDIIPELLGEAERLLSNLTTPPGCFVLPPQSKPCNSRGSTLRSQRPFHDGLNSDRAPAPVGHGFCVFLAFARGLDVNAVGVADTRVKPRH
jgi:hypothetical protein